ncbi:MAG TPA: cyclopropane-fatty-acyl-phospholipid synthase family protein [Caulobacteraceae bacterium]|nr:cyclopropane-fatty-acyl-phospholipid synthase family protein [Caulobacteraceae bacterium]
MSLIRTALGAFEDAPAPDFVSRAVIDHLVGSTRRQLASVGDIDDAFARDMANLPIATHTAEANAQHYEAPAALFTQVLGPRRKYSCCFYETGLETLAQAEEAALALTAVRAELADSQTVLELGCGWGSLSLWMAEHYPRSRITAVSNSHSQRAFIEGEAQRLGLRNLTVVTADMNDFEPNRTFDRIVSVEMFEHMSNWRALLTKARGWLSAEGRLFIHMFSHRAAPYRFEIKDRSDWIAQYFFSGGVMPSHGLIRRFPDLFEVEAEWRWSGAHYQKTADQWLANFDAGEAAIMPILSKVYGAEARIWRRRWRLFFLATAGLFGHAGGAEWGVSHYRLRPAAS